MISINLLHISLSMLKTCYEIYLDAVDNPCTWSLEIHIQPGNKNTS